MVNKRFLLSQLANKQITLCQFRKALSCEKLIIYSVLGGIYTVYVDENRFQVIGTIEKWLEYSESYLHKIQIGQMPINPTLESIKMQLGIKDEPLTNPKIIADAMFNILNKIK